MTRQRVLRQGPGKEGNEGKVKEGVKPLKSLFTIGVVGTKMSFAKTAMATCRGYTEFEESTTMEPSTTRDSSPNARQTESNLPFRERLMPSPTQSGTLRASTPFARAFTDLRALLTGCHQSLATAQRAQRVSLLTPLVPRIIGLQNNRRAHDDAWSYH